MNICGLCKQGRLIFLFRAGEFAIATCTKCHMSQTVTPKKVHRTQLYAIEDVQIYIQKEQEFRSIFAKIIKSIKRFKKSGRFIDIGAGVGLLVDEAQKAGFDAIGFEPSKPSVRLAKKRFQVLLKNSLFKKKNNSADVIVINHVLEHIQYPKKLLEDIYKTLSPGGYLFVGVPNFGSLLARAKRMRWQSLIPQQHRWHFTKLTLDSLILPMGFERCAIQTDNHNRSMHYFWKRPFYAIIDTISQLTKNGEAIFVAYRKL